MLVGVGCSRKHADGWIAHQDDFNSLLADLNSDTNVQHEDDQQSKMLNLEHKSKTTKGRVQ